LCVTLGLLGCDGDVFLHVLAHHGLVDLVRIVPSLTAKSWFCRHRFTS
jgi:hypothetical protein